MIPSSAGNAEVPQVEAFAAQAGQLKAPGIVVAYLADVARTQPQPLAGDQGAGDLPASLPESGNYPLFPAQGREVAHDQHGVGGIQAQSDHIYALACHPEPPRKGQGTTLAPSEFSWQ